MTTTNPLPTNDSSEPCRQCWAPPTHRHELSCDEVSLDQINEFYAWQDEQRAAWDRRDRAYRTACLSIAAVVLLLAVALVWGWLR